MSGNSSVNAGSCADWVSSGTRRSLRGGRAALPVDPYRALCVHFGMLLGVDDFETLDAYHRGKAWLHSAWLHREGVVWGFDVQLEPEHGRLRVGPGLAVDPFGRELHLTEDRCLDLARWCEEHQGELAELEEGADGTRRLLAHVVVGFDSCLERQVPALLEPCEGAGGITAYSRVFETVELLLRLGPTPKPGGQDGPRTLPYHRLRLLFGLDAPIPEEQDGGATSIRKSDQEVLDLKEKVLRLPPAQQTAAWLDALRRCAALDVIDLRPRSEEDEASIPLMPEPSRTHIELAEVAVVMQPPDGPNGIWKLVDDKTNEIDSTVRPSHVATSTIQELLCGVPALLACRTDKCGPQVSRQVKVETQGDGNGSTRITLTTDRPLEPKSVTKEAFRVSTFAAAGWEEAQIQDAVLDADQKTMLVQIAGALADGTRLRIIACGTGPRPILGVDYLPLAGAQSGLPGTEHNGRDFVHMMTYEKE
jgi:hypothetical protein